MFLVKIVLFFILVEKTAIFFYKMKIKRVEEKTLFFLIKAFPQEKTLVFFS